MKIYIAVLSKRSNEDNDYYIDEIKTFSNYEKMATFYDDYVKAMNLIPTYRNVHENKDCNFKIAQYVTDLI